MRDPLKPKLTIRMFEDIYYAYLHGNKEPLNDYLFPANKIIREKDKAYKNFLLEEEKKEKNNGI